MSVRRRHPRAKKATARAFAALGAATCLFAVSLDAIADGAQEFEAGKTRFDAGEYDAAVRLFKSMLDPATPPCASARATAGDGQCGLADPDLIERARVLEAASLVALGRGPEADALFEKVLRANVRYAPNPAVLPPVVIDRFNQVKTRLKPELEQLFNAAVEKERLARLAARRQDEADRKWIQDVQRLASQERVVDKNSRVIAMLPFGIGQFQNHDYGYGAAFLVSEVLAGTTSLVASAITMSDLTNAATQQSAGKKIDNAGVTTNLNTAQAVNIASFATFATLAVIGIVQAQIAFVPERATIRTRALPPRPKPAVVPTVSIVPSGASFGIRGTF